MAQKAKGKRKYELMDNETIDQCLDRMKKDGYMPVRRMEEPIFKEEKINGKTEVIPCGRKIVFEGKLISE
ncbi:MAG: NETI motif-containing protein [Bacillaceae bacterium]|nr:NETI motif-containing protein [Bacillaceae bacterium]